MLRIIEILLLIWISFVGILLIVFLSPILVPCLLLLFVTKKIRKMKKETIYGMILRKKKK